MAAPYPVVVQHVDPHGRLLHQTTEWTDREELRGGYRKIVVPDFEQIIREELGEEA